jgi:hypothetical protein
MLAFPKLVISISVGLITILSVIYFLNNDQTLLEVKANKILNKYNNEIERKKYGQLWYGYVDVINIETRSFGVISIDERTVLSIGPVVENGVKSDVVKVVANADSEQDLNDVKVGDKIFVIFYGFYKKPTLLMADKNNHIRVNKLAGKSNQSLKGSGQ